MKGAYSHEVRRGNDPAQAVTEVTARVEDRLCTLRWRWPDGVQAVCIHKGAAEGPEREALPPSGMKLYTREEYKANNGYRDRMDDIGLVSYTIYARIEDSGETLLLKQTEGANQITVSAGKARIYYSVSQKKPIFGKQKTVHMTITAEVPVPKDVLCYVKKEAGIRPPARTACCFRSCRILPPGETRCRRSRLAKRTSCGSFSPMGVNTDNIMSWYRNKCILCS